MNKWDGNVICSLIQFFKFANNSHIFQWVYRSKYDKQLSAISPTCLSEMGDLSCLSSQWVIPVFSVEKHHPNGGDLHTSASLKKCVEINSPFLYYFFFKEITLAPFSWTILFLIWFFSIKSNLFLILLYWKVVRIH